MKKNIFLLSAAVFMLFISACGATDEDGIFAGSECSFEGSEICSDNGVDILVCQSSTWTIKKECNISIGKKCKQGPDGSLGCFGEGENGSSGNSGDGGFEDPDIPSSDSDSDPIPDNGEENPETADTEESDEDNIPEDQESSDDTDSKPQPDPEPTDPEPTDPEPTIPDDAETPDNDTDSDTDSGEPETPEGQCSSNSDCSGSTPYCSISTSQCIANAVFITEYVEGSGNNKAIEIYNGSKSAIGLSSYTIQQANNGNDWGYTNNYIYTFSVSQLASGATFTVCHASSGDILLSKCNDLATGSTLAFNGDDGMALFNGTSIVDQIGNSTDYAYWSVAGVENATVDRTLRRKTTVIQGTTDWASSAGTTAENSQWEVLDKDTYDGLGTR